MKGEAFSWILAAISLLTYFFETYKQNKDDKLTEEYYDFRPEGGGGWVRKDYYYNLLSIISLLSTQCLSSRLENVSVEIHWWTCHILNKQLNISLHLILHIIQEL